MTHEHDIDPIDDAVRSFHAGPLEAETERVTAAQKRSFTANRPVQNAPSRRRFWRPRRLAFLTTTVVAGAVAATVAIALLPSGPPDRTTRGLSRLAPSASAAEVLEQARGLVLDSGSEAGTGDVWHGVARSFHKGELMSVNEQWYDTRTDENLLAAWGRDRTDDNYPTRYAPWNPDDHPVRGELLLIDRVDADGYQRLRRFERPSGQAWSFPPGDLSPTRAMDRQSAPNDRQRQLATAMASWLSVASSRDATIAQLRAATHTFMKSTPDYFSAQPEITPPLDSRPHSMTKADMARFTKFQESVPVRQIVYLLTTVQATPRANAALYDVIGGFDSLERLDDVTIDGRAAIRLRYDQSSPNVSPSRERVLVLDATSGEIIRTETLDRASWTEVEPARRVDEIGASADLCRDDIDVPCDLLEGRGKVASIADTFVTDMAVRYSAHAENRSNKRRLGGAAPAPLCIEMSDLGTCEPQSREEAQRLRAIAANTELLARAISPMDAWVTAEPLASLADTDGIVRLHGQCFRDWRFLAICRG